MKLRIDQEETKNLYQHVLLTNEEITKHAYFGNLGPEELEELKETVFNLSLLFLKTDANGTA